MAITIEKHPIIPKIVLVFDICSSSNILEDLVKTGNLKRWATLLSGLKNFLVEKSSLYQFELYKFMGDGWILLFEPNINGQKLIDFIEKLCKKYNESLYPKVEAVLDTPPDLVGLTIGLDKGDLVKMVFQQKEEYVGRPINIAARLQSAVKEKDKQPNNKCLISRSLFNQMKRTISNDIGEKEVTRQLRNISGGKDFRCIKISI